MATSGPMAGRPARQIRLSAREWAASRPSCRSSTDSAPPPIAGLVTTVAWIIRPSTRTIARRTFLVGPGRVRRHCRGRGLRGPCLSQAGRKPAAGRPAPRCIVSESLRADRRDGHHADHTARRRRAGRGLDPDPSSGRGTGCRPQTVRTGFGPASGPTTTPESRPKAFRWPHGTTDLRRAADGWPGPLPPGSGLNITRGSTTVPDSYDRLRAAGASVWRTRRMAARIRG